MSVWLCFSFLPLSREKREFFRREGMGGFVEVDEGIREWKYARVDVDLELIESGM